MTAVASDAVEKGMRPPFSLDRFGVLRDGRVLYRVKKSGNRASRVRIMTPVECLARRQTPDCVR